MYPPGGSHCWYINAQELTIHFHNLLRLLPCDEQLKIASSYTLAIQLSSYSGQQLRWVWRKLGKAQSTQTSKQQQTANKRIFTISTRHLLSGVYPTPVPRVSGPV